VVEWIVGIGFVEEVNQTVNHRVDVQDGFPVLPQYIQTYFSLQIDVGVVNAGVAFDFGW